MLNYKNSPKRSERGLVAGKIYGSAILETGATS